LNQVTLYIDSMKTIEIVHELKKIGWVQNVDFDFAFHQSHWDNMTGEIPKQAVFTFYNESHASYFSLRWG